MVKERFHVAVVVKLKRSIKYSSKSKKVWTCLKYEYTQTDTGMWRRLLIATVQCSQRSYLKKEIPSALPWSKFRWATSWKPKEEISTKEAALPDAEFLLGFDEIDELADADRNVQMIFDKSHASHNQILKLEMAKLIDKYKLKEGDTGSIEVQVAALTLKINNISRHMQSNKKDYSCKHGLIQVLHRRRKLLVLLKERRPNAYQELLRDLKLKAPVPLPKIQFRKKKQK